MPQASLDRIDLAILAVLQREGRLSNADLAERVNLSPRPPCAGCSGWKARA
jgi:Lrp/AsnC family leucine-responsive transcriptional regulator